MFAYVSNKIEFPIIANHHLNHDEDTYKDTDDSDTEHSDSSFDKKPFIIQSLSANTNQVSFLYYLRHTLPYNISIFYFKL